MLKLIHGKIYKNHENYWNGAKKIIFSYYLFKFLYSNAPLLSLFNIKMIRSQNLLKSLILLKKPKPFVPTQNFY